MKQLINEYKETCKNLEGHILKLEKQLSTARGNNAFNLQKRIELLKEEVLDLKYIIRYLMLTYQS